MMPIRFTRRLALLMTTAAVVWTTGGLRAQQQIASAIGVPPERSVVLSPTSHPTISRELSQLWFAPTSGDRARTPPVDVGSAMRASAAGDYARSIATLSRTGAQQGTLGTYVAYHLAIAQLRLGRPEQARALFQQIQERQPIGYLSEAAFIGEGESLEAMGQPAAALDVYQRMLDAHVGALDDVVMHLGRAARGAGRMGTAYDAFTRVYYEFGSSELSPLAGSELATLPNLPPIGPGTDRYRLELGRAERMFATKQYAPARSVYDTLKPLARGDDKELVDLRIAESNYFLKRARDARDGVHPYIRDAKRQGEALYFYAAASRDLGDIAEYIKTVRRIVDEFPTQSWAEEGLNNLASYYIIDDQDDQADAVFRELYERYPHGRYAERAAWKAGWRAYLGGGYADAIRFFERAAADFPRSDYRPPWLYWSGRAHDALNEAAVANARYLLVATDYLNSYYGRLAVARMGGKVPALQTSVVDGPAAVGEGYASAPPNSALIRALAAAGLYDDAHAELKYAQRVWGDSAAIQATMAWVSREQGMSETGNRRFTLVRGSITTMRRAYPQFLAAGGERLPREILTVIFPLEHWDLIRKYAAAQSLDPYLVAALVAQESTFVADIKSSANAVGLMQLLPSTARQYAKKLGLRYSSRLLTSPDANIRMGTAYFADKIRQFGGVHLALASYNAGETPVRQWLAERPGMAREEFIDDIPYPETQNYVKRIIGTAEDYRRLYGK